MPITPIFEQPPVTADRRGIDWTEVLAALTQHPDEWARVDGPFPNDKKGRSNSGNHIKSLRAWADRADTAVEARKAVKDDEIWVYARTIEQPAAKPAPTPAVKKPAVAAVPNPTPNAGGDFGGGDHNCPTCGAEFRTNTRLRQHQANAHRAS